MADASNKASQLSRLVANTGCADLGSSGHSLTDCTIDMVCCGEYNAPNRRGVVLFILRAGSKIDRLATHEKGLAKASMQLPHSESVFAFRPLYTVLYLLTAMSLAALEEIAHMCELWTVLLARCKSVVVPVPFILCKRRRAGLFVIL